MRRTTLWLMAVAVLIATPSAVRAFCGFYVSGADSDLYNNATMVLMLRDGTKTVLSMQNNYQGPPENFAMIVPVPVVLQEENVKTLDPEVFKRIDQLAAPRLVEYWEEDPCMKERYLEEGMMARPSAMRSKGQYAMKKSDLGVTIEAQFKVGEYEIVILSAKDSSGLDKWLKLEGYNIPDNSEPLLRPYVESGSKFFVAKVDVTKVKFDGDQVMLSPLRFHYDTKTFSLPVRLGLVNSAGTQDLIVHILAKGDRYEVANYDNVTIPTNIDVDDTTRNEFGAFYAALYDSTLEKNKGAVITEYSWDASTCDPCPVPGLTGQELATLGGDVLPGAAHPGEFVLTRLHARYSKDSLGEDLVFKTAKPIAGGREWRTGPEGQLEKGSVDSHANMFQARYAIRHEWTGAVECKDPIRGRWGGPPAGLKRDASPRAAMDLAFAPRGTVELPKLVKQDIPEIGLVHTAVAAPTVASKKAAGGEQKQQAKQGKGGCGCRAGGDAPGGAVLALLVLVALRRRCERSR